MFGGVIEMLPERKGNRMAADIITNKTKELGWAPKYNLRDYIQAIKANDRIK
jgi:UDP-glucose 4-epimerase